MAVVTSEDGRSTVRALDARRAVSGTMFRRVGEGAEWETPVLPAPFGFDELIYSWRSRLKPGQGWRLYLRVAFDDGSSSPWLYAGFWGEVKRVENRTNPQFEHGSIEMDQLLLRRDASAYQFRLVQEGPVPLDELPSLFVIVTKNKPSEELAAQFEPDKWPVPSSEIILDLPLRLQRNSAGEYTPDRCQSAAVASAMEYFGTSLALEDIISWTHDPEYNYPGIWPRTLGVAAQYGFDVYIERFRSWDQVRATVAQNKVILCSIRMPKGGDYIAPPYPDIGGHIVALNGVTADGRVVVTDSALGKDNKGFRCQWLARDFEKVWFEQKGGVGMVICPPPGASLRTVAALPPFPQERYVKPRPAAP